MNYTIEKQLKKAPIVKYIMIGSISLTLLLWILGLALSIIQITAAGTISFMVTVSITLVYIEMFRQLSKSMKLLNKFGLQDVVSDLKTTEFNLPKSKIYMGSRAFYAKKPATVLPYLYGCLGIHTESKVYGYCYHRRKSYYSLQRWCIF